jgi:hypothetical protein
VIGIEVMKLRELLRRQAIYLVLLLLLLVAVLATVGKRSLQKYRLKRAEEAPHIGDWVYVSVEKSNPLFRFSGRPGKWDSSDSVGDKVKYQLGEGEGKAEVITVPREIPLHRCPPLQGGIDDPFMGTIRIWRGSELNSLDQQADHEAKVGDRVTVEIKDLDRWLFTQLDFGRLKSELNDLPTHLEDLVKGAVETRRSVDLLRGINKVNYTLRRALRDDTSTPEARKNAWQDLIRLIDGDNVLRRIKDKMPAQLVGDEPTLENIYKLERQFLPIKVWSQAFTERRFKQLTLTLNGIALVGVTPQNDYNGAEIEHEKRPSFEKDLYQWARFVLERKEIDAKATDRANEVAKANESAWFKLVGKPALSLPCNVTLRLPEEGLELPTKITVAAAHPDCQFYLIGIEQWRFLATVLLFFLILWFLVWLARTTDILRDSSGRVRPDGIEPVSLGRTQMAFWFILTVGAWAFLWVTTGNHDTINDTCLILLGIGSGTALGAALIESTGTKFLVTSPLDRPRDKIKTDIADAILVRLQKLSSLIRDYPVQTRKQFIAVLRKIKKEETRDKRGANKPLDELLNKLQTEWNLEEETTKEGVEEAISALARELKPARKNGREEKGAPAEPLTEVEVLGGELELLGAQQAAFRKMPDKVWKRLFADWLGESSTTKYSFHRFQMLAWTLMLGFVFVIKVSADRAMPEFNAMTLGLLGISAGTYLGFKFPAARKEEVAKTG